MTGTIDDDHETGPSTLYLVKRLELAVRALMDDALRPLGLTTLQYTALTVLERRSGLSSAQLARRSFLRPQTMNVMVQTLEERGLIQRDRDPANRRVLVATLTERGREVLREAAPHVEGIEASLLGGMSAARGEAFRGALRHGITALTAEAKLRQVAEMPGD
ncbi:MarR family transcriptional regulator [Nocardia yamanashiensis]|uniref:MarR family winged helix-turn-helix transcriptional regulator n=1 Tax=Nocardia yamanashiensis TaxID=209247 RepID=UPI001E4F960A|nr:MarR family transcriptional regulator [Nocardia yamanashiensis]UGT41522.1 MarR family transcriptional regulator [Nocardia yamanashiensis]